MPESKVIRQEECVERASLFAHHAQAKHNFSVATLPQRVKVDNASEGLRNSLWGRIRLWALDEFFTQFPQYRGKITFLQIAIPTRTEIGIYQLYGDLIRETVVDINQRHLALFKDIPDGGNEWIPILLQEGRIGFDDLVALYGMADFALVSSVNDGMNLVAKEYVAA